MLWSAKKLRGYKILARDGEIGRVVEFYFDDEDWTIRYLVVDTGDWLPRKKVLIAPAAFYGKPDWDTRTFPVILTKEMVKESPDVDTDKPVSRQRGPQLIKYYNWPIYRKAEELGSEISRNKEKGDSHLRSTEEVMGYHIKVVDGEVGHIEDFIIDDEKWNIKYIAVDTRNWLPRKKVVILPKWIERIDWAASKVYACLLKDKIKTSPEYDYSELVKQ